MTSPSQPFDAATLPLDGLRLIEASAGTGKTYSLAGLYLRLIIEEQASVRDILVMTFTRAATQELRDRIRTRLSRAALIAHDAELARPGHPEDEFTCRIIARSAQTSAALARRLADAATRVDEATIVTIHGFAQRAAAENAFESALTFERGETVDDQAVFRQMTADYWREHVHGPRSAASRMLALWPEPDKLYQTIKSVLGKAHARLVGDDPERLDALRERLSDRWPETVARLTEILDLAFESGAFDKRKKLYKSLKQAESAGELLVEFDANVVAAIDSRTHFKLPEWFDNLVEPESAFSKSGESQNLARQLGQLDALALLPEFLKLIRTQCISEAAQAVLSRAAKYKSEHRQYSYDDLITALHEALENPNTGDKLADALRARWPYALVDEFQDTDPLQYASLAGIYLQRPRDRGALILIGDPKQAIYGFRGGDVYAYLAAAHAAGESRYTLTTNYRSTQAILDAIEALYDLPNGQPFAVPEIDFPHIVAGGTGNKRRLIRVDAKKTNYPAFTLWRLLGNQTHTGKGKLQNPSKETDVARLVEKTVADILAFLGGERARWQHEDGSIHPVTPGDIAVLVNSHHEANRLQRALALAGIHAVCLHQQSVFSSAEAADLQLILRAMAQPDDAVIVRAAQTTRLIGKRLADLFPLADDDRAMQSVIESFQTFHNTWHKSGILSALESLFLMSAPRLLRLPDGERRMSNYLQLGELLADAEAGCYGMGNVVDWLDQHIAAARDGTLGAEDESQLRLESDENLVRISTVHSSKGLEYPIVFLPFATRLGFWDNHSHQRRPDQPPMVFHRRKPGQSATSETLIDLIGGNKEHEQQAILEDRSESLRLLYVALTRAEHALIVSWREPDDYARGGALNDLLQRDASSGDEALERLQTKLSGTLAIEPVDTEQPPPDIQPFHEPGDEAAGPAHSDLPEPRLRWSTYSFSRLAHAPAGHSDTSSDVPAPGAFDETVNTVIDTINTEAEDKLPALDERLSGTRFGSAVHEILEQQLGHAGHEPWPAPGQAIGEAHRHQVYTTLRHYGLVGDTADDPRIDTTANLVARTLHAPLPDIGPLAHTGSDHLITEMEFMMRLRESRGDAVFDTLRTAGYLQTNIGGLPGQVLHGLMQGFIDLIVAVDGRYFILDYKTNHLGDTLAAYSSPNLKQAISRAHYDLQYLIYSVALHRHLRRCLGKAYDPRRHLGGVQYLFVRAMDGKTTNGIFTDQPDVVLIERLDTLFDGVPEQPARPDANGTAKS